MGALKTTWNVTKAFVRGLNPWYFFKDVVPKGLAIDEHKKAFALTKDSKDRIVTAHKSHMAALRANRDPWAEGAPDMSDFSQVLEHWGITPGEIDTVIKGMVMEILSFVFIACVAVYIIFMPVMAGMPITSLLIGPAGCLLLFASVFRIVARAWKIQILYNEEFTYWKDWFLWGLFDCFGKETPIARTKRLQEEG